MSNNSKALKSGVWYIAGNFIVKGIAFFTTPLFTRLLSKIDYGLFSNYSSWLNTFSVFATLGLGASFVSARFDYEEDFDGYISSTLVLSTLVTLIWGIVINVFPSSFTGFTSVEIKYINIMVIYFMSSAAIDMFQTRERYFYKYKTSVLISVITAVSTSLLSIILITNLNDRLMGRIMGSAIPTIVIGFILYIILICRGRKVRTAYWKYAIPICLPYIPHGLSLTLLNSMDKMMITKICGPEFNALYSVAYTCGMIITLFINSLNTAFAPWLGEKLNSDEHKEIRDFSKKYVLLFASLSAGILLIAPEVLLIMGGKQYREAVYVMPPVAMGCVCQFLYTMFVNIEQFKKKTVGMAFASISAALLNYILNAIFIPQYGYIAAAYTTLVSYIWLLMVHMILVKQIGYIHVYPIKYIFAVLGAMGVYMVCINFVYKLTVIRYVMVVTYLIVFIWFGWEFRNLIIGFFKKKT